MSRIQTIIAVILVAAVLAGLRFYNVTDISHQAIQFHLRLYGSSIYEYHDKTGQWPTHADDLAKTSLTQKSPYWKVMLENEINVILWPRGLKPDPKDNPDAILVYHNKGLLASMGRVWVCWGDLRTEYISSEELQMHLRAPQE